MSGRSMLSHTEFFQLCEWVKKPENLEGIRYLVDAAEKASKSFGVSVSVYAMRQAIDATKIQFDQAIVRDKTSSSKAADTMKTHRTLARFLVYLAENLNVEVPLDVLKIAGKQRGRLNDKREDVRREPGGS